MKKILLIFALIFASLGLFACNSSQDNAQVEESIVDLAEEEEEIPLEEVPVLSEEDIDWAEAEPTLTELPENFPKDKLLLPEDAEIQNVMDLSSYSEDLEGALVIYESPTNYDDQKKFYEGSLKNIAASVEYSEDLLEEGGLKYWMAEFEQDGYYYSITVYDISPDGTSVDLYFCEDEGLG